MYKEQSVIDEDTSRFFVWAVWKFFNSSTNIEAEVGAPYLCENHYHEDYTGIIGVSGSKKGTLYFTISRKFMEQLIDKGCDHIDKSTIDEYTYEELIKDYTGEIANTVSGNVRNYLGEYFLISVPIVVCTPGRLITPTSEQQGIVFPVTWMGHKCSLVLCFNRTYGQQPKEEEVLIFNN
jgi:chemotaxis protein CheX